MNQSSSIANIAAALVKAQAQFKVCIKDSNNPFFKSKYADLSTCMEAVKESLVENGLAILQLPADNDRGIVLLETVLLHVSGEWISSLLPMPTAKSDPQAFGAAITYARRFALCSILGLTPEDDDGNSASEAHRFENRKPASQTPPRKAAPTVPAEDLFNQDPLPPSLKINADQRKALTAAIVKSGHAIGDCKKWLREFYAASSSAEITVKDYQNVLTRLSDPSPLYMVDFADDARE